jgi:hypothetical protein
MQQIGDILQNLAALGRLLLLFFADFARFR